MSDSTIRRVKLNRFHLARFFFLKILFLFVLFVSYPFETMAIDVETKHPVYLFLDRCELKGVFDSQISGSRPYSRRSVALLLKDVEENKSLLSKIERQKLSRYLYEFEDDLPSGTTYSDPATDDFAWLHNGSKFPWKNMHIFKNRKYLYSDKGENYLVTLNPHVANGFELADNGDINGSLNIFATGYHIQGYYYNFGLHATSRDAHLSGETSLVDSIAYPLRYESEDEERIQQGFDFDESDALITYEIPHFYLMFGKTGNVWGRALSGNLALSDNPTTYTQLRMKFDFGPMEVTLFHGKLIQDPPIYTAIQNPVDSLSIIENYEQKWIAGHRYQITATDWFQLGLYDVIVYGNRGIEFDYLPPLTFLWSAEHYNRDQDNMMMGLDFRFLLGKRITAHANWFLDELRFSEQGSDWYGNKHGYQAGIRQVDFLGIPDSDVSFEYTRLRPYAYSHTNPNNVGQHYGSNLGFYMQPNSDLLYFGWQQDLSAQLHSSVEFRRMRHGANPASGRNVGGDSRRGYVWGDSQTAPFLDGDLETLNEITIGVEYELSYQVLLQGFATLGWQTTEYDAGGKSEKETQRFGFALKWYPYRWR